MQVVVTKECHKRKGRMFGDESLLKSFVAGTVRLQPQISVPQHERDLCPEASPEVPMRFPARSTNDVPAPAGRTSLAQRFSAGKAEKTS